MEKVKYDFKKISNDKFAFIGVTPNFVRTEECNKQYVKDHYKDMVNQRNELMKNMAQARKMMDDNKVEKDIEMERFIEMANNAAKYKKYLESENNHKAMLDMIENINGSLAQIEKVLPELKRMGK